MEKDYPNSLFYFFKPFQFLGWLVGEKKIGKLLRLSTNSPFNSFAETT